MSNFCHNCGEKVTPKQRFCSNCGETLVFDANGHPVVQHGNKEPDSDLPGWVIFYLTLLAINTLSGIYIYIVVDDVYFSLTYFIISLLTFTLFIMILKRSPRVPDMVIVFHISSFVASFLTGVDAQNPGFMLGSIIGSVIWGAIWINYFHKAKIQSFFSQ